MDKYQEFKCDYIFTEEKNRLYPLTFKFEVPTAQVRDIYSPRMEYAATLPIEHLRWKPETDNKFTVVGSGPSLEAFTNQLDGTICTINRAHEYLISEGVIPHMHIIFENDIEDPTQSLGGKPHKDVTYYVCSTCPEGLFDKLKEYKVVLWHNNFTSKDYHKFFDSIFPDEPTIDMPLVSFIKAIGIAKVLGYRKFELYGIDCSFPIPQFGHGSDHVTGHQDSVQKIIICARNGGNQYRRYISNGFYLYQIIQFMNSCKDLDVKIHGDGILGFVNG